MFDYKSLINGCDSKGDIDSLMYWLLDAEKKLPARDFVDLFESTISEKYLYDERFYDFYERKIYKTIESYGLRDIEGLLKEYKISEAKSLFFKCINFIDKKMQDEFDGLLGYYEKQKNEKTKVIETIKGLFKSFKFSDALLYFEKNSHCVEEKEFISLKKNYEELFKSEKIEPLKKNLEKLLSEFKFGDAEDLFEEKSDEIENSGIIYREFKDQYLLIKQGYENIYDQLTIFCFEKADALFDINKHIFSFKNDWYFKVRKEYELKIPVKLEMLLQEFQFADADILFDTHKKHLCFDSYVILRKEYENNIKVKLDNLLSQFKFKDADSLFNSCKVYIENNWYVNLKKGYEHNYYILIKNYETLLQNGVKEADGYFFNQRDIYEDDYLQLRNKRISNFLSKKIGLNFSNEQIESIGVTDFNCLVTARAGSGKTSVITSKAFFLIEHENIHPDKIMLLAFNKKASIEMKERIRRNYGLGDFNNAMTFHRLANQLCPSKERILEKDEQYEFISKIVSQSMTPVFKMDMYNFFRTEMRELDDDTSFISKKDYYIYLRNQIYTTLAGVEVKSRGEKFIGDFLFEHGIMFEYEYVFDWNNKNYRPDFTLFKNYRPTVIIEHWGIDEDDATKSVPLYWSKTWDDYKKEMDYKRKFWKEYNVNNNDNSVIFIETSIVDLKHGRAFFEEILKKRLSDSGIAVHKLPLEELYEHIHKKMTPKLIKMFLQYIQKARKQRLLPCDLENKIKMINDNFIRTKIFLNLSNIIYKEYISELKKKNRIDYDEQLERGISIIHETKGDCGVKIKDNRISKIKELEFLMIDEFQDFSLLFYDMIDAIKKYNKKFKLFCVGDDWQAINGFAGSDLKYFKKFGDYQNPSVKKQILTNYRSLSEIVSFSNEFMKDMGSPSKAFNKRAGEILMCYIDEKTVFVEKREYILEKHIDHPDERFLTFGQRNGQKHNFDQSLTIARVLKVCHSIINDQKNFNKTIAILSRNGSLSSYYNTLDKFYEKLKSTCRDFPSYTRFDKKTIQISTVHSFKGLEADVIILLGVTKGVFPLIHPDNELYEIFGTTIADVFDEEKRLFYVAITRAKEKLYIFTESGNESEFILDSCKMITKYKIN